MRFPLLLVWCVFLTVSVSSADQAFPSEYIPFTGTVFVGSPAANGDRLVSGTMTGASYLTWLALQPPSGPNEMFSNSPIELAPGQFFSGVYVPTDAEKTYDYSGCPGCTIVDPAVFEQYGQILFFPDNSIPVSRRFPPTNSQYFSDDLVGLMVVRVNSTVPEPSMLPFALFAVVGLLLGRRFALV